ncbi:Phosphoribosylamine-glycine ligase, partial [Pyrenophora tritici-repentis]
LKDIMLDREFGTAGDERRPHNEITPPAQDHKRIFDNDQGPNTGGMGTYAPTRIAPKDVLERIDKDILQPTIDGMRNEGFEFKGVLFTGLMMTKNGPKVLEYNVRFGDPETQSLLALMEGDLAQVMVACAEGRLKDRRSGCCGWYPGSYAKGTPMTLDPVPEARRRVLPRRNLLLGQHAQDGGWSRYRIDSYGANVEEAVAKAYKGIECIHFEGMQFRKDIAGRALKK